MEPRFCLSCYRIHIINNISDLNNQEGNLTGNLKEFYLAMKENPNITVSELLKIVEGMKKLTDQLIAELKNSVI